MENAEYVATTKLLPEAVGAKILGIVHAPAQEPGDVDSVGLVLLFRWGKKIM